MTQAMTKPELMTLEEFLEWYPDGRGLFELHNGKVVQMQPPGTHAQVAAEISMAFILEIERLKLPYLFGGRGLVKSINSEDSAFLPDITIVDNNALKSEPMWREVAVITKGETIPLIVEVVSTNWQDDLEEFSINWQDDYEMKFTEYEKLGIAEYWIVDYLGLGGRRYLGNPKQPTIFVYQLDDLHEVLEKDRSVGHYRPGYENYRNLFETVAELSHQSCLIFNSWELPLEIINLKNKNAPVACLQLEGLDKAANKILEKEGLLDEEKWSELIDIYGGNPHWLKMAATEIRDLFKGRVAEYLQYNPLFFDDLTVILERHLSRLSELERQILLQISGETEPVSISWLLENRDLSSSDILNAIRSLEKRSLLEKIERENSTLFAVKRIFKEYLLTASP